MIFEKSFVSGFPQFFFGHKNWVKFKHDFEKTICERFSAIFSDTKIGENSDINFEKSFVRGFPQFFWDIKIGVNPSVIVEVISLENFCILFGN